MVVSKPTREAEALYGYLCSLPGKGVLTGQTAGPKKGKGDAPEIAAVMAATGKYPAMIGLDIGSGADVAERAIAYWKRGGLVCLTWEWVAPTKGHDAAAQEKEIDLALAVTRGTAQNRALLADIDQVAKELIKLRDAGVPVLWRPLQQPNAGRFWWGKGGPELYQELWQILFQRLSYHHQLDNLIWVLGFSAKPDQDWYPGDEYVDIAGVATAEDFNHGRTHRHLLSVVGFDRPVALQECSVLPDLGAAAADNARWIWFLASREAMATPDHTALQRTYGDAMAITLDEVPALGRVSHGK